MSPQDNISICAWHDSKIELCITNVHPPCCVVTRLRMKGMVGQQEINCPLPFAKYNSNMGAIDDFD
eukprot:3113023-Rhodomonas_salina.1